MYFYYDAYYWIMILPAIIFALVAQSRVSSTFNKFSNLRTRHGMTGAQAADHVLRAHGLYDVKVERVAGNLTDHYDPKANVIRLSQSVYDSPSVAAVGVAAHEAGHAMQYGEGYGLVKLRTAIIPVSQIGSKLSIPLIIIGLLFNYEPLFAAGIIFFAAAFVFQVVTLPVEYNASSRALRSLESSHVLTEEEIGGARKVLSAAAMTYVAALAVSLMQLLRLMLLFSGGRRRY